MKDLVFVSDIVSRLFESRIVKKFIIHRTNVLIFIAELYFMGYNGCVTSNQVRDEWFVFQGSFLWIPVHEDGDVIVAAGNLLRKEMVDMGNEFYINIGYAVAWCVKYIFIPFGVAVSAKVFADRLLRPLPERQRKKRSNKNRL